MITLIKNRVQKKVSTGYSWKSLLFGCLYPLFRGDMSGAVRHFAWAFFTAGVAWFIIPFNYNKRYYKELLIDGYEPSDEKSLSYLKRKIGYEKSKL